MATAPITFNRDIESDGTVELLTWTLTTANSDGAAFLMPAHADICWQAQGTWGSGTLTLQGSNDGTNWFTLSNAAGGTAATFTADGGKQTIEVPRYKRPNLTGSTGATITVTALVRRNTPMRGR